MSVSWRDSLKAKLSKVRDRLEDIPDADLADFGKMAREDGRFYLDIADAVDGELLRRMRARGATMMNTPKWTLEQEATRSYKWDLELAKDNLRPELTPAQWDEVYSVTVPEPPKPKESINTTKMLALGKRLGLDLSPFYRIEETAPRVKYTPVRDEEAL